MNQKLDDYVAMPHRMEVVEDTDEGGFVVSFPELPGCITCGDTMESALENAKDAKKAWMEAALEEGIRLPAPSQLWDDSEPFQLNLPRNLHKTLEEHSRLQGVSLQQYCIHLLSKNDFMLWK